MTWKKIVSFAMLCGILLSLVCVPADAATTTEDVAKRWNIMLVVDGSGSLYSGHNPSDKEGLRYEALSMMIDTLQGTGNYVGAVVFNANATNDSSWEGMYRGISLDTGLRPMDSIADKEQLKQEIKDAPYSGNTGGDTDIGTALLVAQQHLSQMNNGLDNAIFLFSDGAMELDYAATRDKAYEHLNTACKNIRNDDIKLFGVFLNCNNSKTTQVRDIVMDTKAPDSLLENLYLEVNENSDLTDAIDIFSRFLGYRMRDDKLLNEIEYIRVPGIGVEEVNIRIRTANGEDIPDDLEIAIVRPDGTYLTHSEMDSICSRGRSYKIYKLMNPECGIWTLKVVFPEGNPIDIFYTPILSVNIDADFETTPDFNTLQCGGDAKVTFYLVQNGVRITDPLAYREYQCMFYMRNKLTGKMKYEMEVVQDANGEYSVTIPLDEYAQFEVFGEFVFEDLRVPTRTEIWTLENAAPTCAASIPALEGVYGLFHESAEVLDLSDAVYAIQDAEDPFDKLSITFSSDSCNLDALTFNGSVLEIDGSAIGNGDLIVTIADTQGASCAFTISVSMTDLTVPIIAIIAAIVLFILISLVIMIRGRNSTRTNGNCAIVISVPISDAGDTRDVACRGLTPPGAVNRARSLNMYEMLEADIKNTLDSSCRLNCDHANVSYDRYIETVNSICAELQRATVTSVFFKDKRKKTRSSDMICIKYRSVKDTITTGGSSTLTMNNIRVTFLYSATGAQKDDDLDPVDNTDMGVDVPEQVVDYNDPSMWGGKKDSWTTNADSQPVNSYPESAWDVPAQNSTPAWGSAPAQGSAPAWGAPAGNDYGGSQGADPDSTASPWADAWNNPSSPSNDDDFGF